jgi:ATP-dependent DNA helicase RecQ
LELRKDPTRTKKPKRATSAPAPVGPEHADLWDALRACRRDLADEHGVPAYVIFHDRTLHEMMLYRPRNADELLAINGIGQAKLERYGERFLEVLAEA